VAEYFYVSTTYEDQHGYITVSTDGGSTWPYTIEDHTSTLGSSSTKNYYSYSLDAFAGESNVAVAFNFTNMPYGYDYWYIDDVSIDEYVPPTEDAGVVSIDNPPVMGYTNGNYTITATIENMLADSTIIDSVLFEVDTAGVVVFSDMTYPGTYILGYASQQFSSSTQWNPTFEYWYVATVTFWGSGDGFAGNNSRSEYKIMKDVRAYPYLEDMEYSTIDSLPTVLFILSGTSSGVYWSTSYSHSPTHCSYFSYSPYPREVAMVFPPVDLSSGTAPMLEFFEATYLTYWGDDLDQTHTVGIISGDFDLNNIDTLWTYGPDTHTPWDRTDWANGPGQRLDMSAYVGDTVWVVMDYNEPANPTYGSYWYLDDISLKEMPVGDVGPTDFVSGLTGMAGQPYSPVVEVTNYGGDTPDVPVKLVIDSAGTAIYTQWDTITAIPSFGTANASFADFTPVAGGIYAMTATTELVTEDNDPSNDTLTANLAVFTSVEDFEATNGALTGNGDWEWGTPTNPEGPASAYSGVNLWATNLAGDYTSGLHTLEFNLAVGTGGAGLGMASWYDTEASYDGGNFSISTDGGGTWVIISPDIGYSGTANSSNPIPLGDSIFTGHGQGFWETPFFDLSAYAGDTVAAKLQFGADGSVFYPGWHVDDFAFLNCAIYVPSIDAALVSIDDPVGVIFTGSTVTPKVTIANNGDTPTTVDVTFRILDNTQTVVYNQTETSGIVPGGGGTLQHTFATSWSATPEGTYDLIANVTLAGDGNPTNDTSTASIEVATHYSTGGPDDFGYRWIDNISLSDEDPPVFNWIDLTTSPTADTAGTSSGNLGLFPIGFDFEFYGQTFDSVYINGYGYLQFGAYYSTSGNDCPLPSSTTPYYYQIAGFWDSGYPYYLYDGATIYETMGTAPDRYMVIQYHNHRYLSYYNDMDWEIIIHENGNIVFQYLNVAEEASNYGVGQSATVGIQSDTSGTRSGITYLCSDDPIGNRLVDSLAIKWYVPVFAHDVVVDEFVVPATSLGEINVPFTPEVLFSNNGTSDETNVPVRLLINPGAYNDPQTIAVLDSGTSYSQTFTQFTPTAGGVYSLTAISELVGDEDPASDTLQMNYAVFDQVLDFEAGNGGLVANNDWEWGTPSNVGPSTAHSGSNCWGTIIDGNRTSGYYEPSGYIYSDLSVSLDLGLDNNAAIGFYQWYQTSGVTYDSLNVIINAGAGDILLSTTYGTTPDWEFALYDLSAYTGTVELKFQYFSRSSVSNPGWYIDDLGLASCEILSPDIDVTPLAVSGEADPLGVDYDTITVSNTGDIDLNFTAAVIMDPFFTNIRGELEQLNAADNTLDIRRVPEVINFETINMDVDRELDAGEKIDVPMNDYSSPDPLPIINVNIAYENFDDGLLPTGWSIVDGGTAGYTWQLHSTSSCVRSSTAWSIDWMIVDSDCPGSGITFDEQLLTDYYDCSAYSLVNLAFNHYFNNLGTSDSGRVEIRNGSAGTWNWVASYTSDVTASENYDITSLIGTGDSVQVRFQYWDNNTWAWYWGIDDFLLYEPDTPWLSLDTYSGTVPPAGTPIDIEVTFDAEDVGPGIYTGTIQIVSNDPDETVIDIPATFIVGGLGTVAGQVTDANTTSPIEGAVVTATWTSTTTIVDTTDAGGNYSILITPGTVNVTVEAVGYTSDSQDVIVTADLTTTHNVALTAPIATIDQSDVIDTVAIGDTAVYGRYLHNTGTAPLTYNVSLNFDLAAPLSIRSNAVSERIDNVIKSVENADAAPFRYESGNVPVITAFQDSVFAFDPQTPTGDIRCLGIEFDGTYFWVTGAGDGTGTQNRIHKFDANSNYMTSYPQNTSSAWGWRDLAWDGQYLYASDDYDIDVFDPATGTVVNTYVGVSPVNPARALAYDPVTGNFWTASFSSSIYEFDLTGFVHNTFTNTKSIYGMAWDEVSEGGPWLWVHSQDGTPGMEISRFNPRDGVYDGPSFQSALIDGNTTGIAGGACITTEWDPSIAAIFVLGQGDPVDFVYGYELANNITWFKVLSGGSGDIPAGDSALIEFQVDFADSTIVPDSTYEAEANINNNDPYSVPVIHFAITAGAGGCDYIVGDVNGSNNYNGLDITYGVNFFKYGSPLPQCTECPPCAGWHYCGDVNNSCNYNGLDITYGVNYFKYGSPTPQPCDDCPPIGPASIGDDELRPAVQDRESRSIEQPSIETKSISKKGNELKR